MPNGKLNKNVVNTICYRTTFEPTDVKHDDDKNKYFRRFNNYISCFCFS